MFEKVRNIFKQHRVKCLSLLDQGLVSGGNFFVGILLAREFGLSIYGEFTLAWLVVLFCGSIHQGWLISPMFTFSPQKKGIENVIYFNALFAHQILFSISAAVISLFFIVFSNSYFPNWEIHDLGPLISMTVFTHLMYTYFRKKYYALENINKALVIDTLVYGSQIIGLTIIASFYVLTLEVTFKVICLSYLSPILFEIREFSNFKWENSSFSKLAKKHWKFSKWLVGTTLLQWISGNFFIIVAGSLLGPIAVGAFRILQNIIGVLHVLFLAIENYVPVRASRIFQAQGLLSLQVFLRKITWKGSIVTLFISLLIAVFGKNIIALLYSGKYTEYAYLLYGFAFMYLLVFIGINFRFAIRTLEETRSIFIAYVLSAAFSLSLAIPIIRSFGVEGILIGLILTQVIMQAYFIYSLRSKLNLLWKLSI